MGDLQAWLAAMPVDQVDGRIDELERELAFLRVVRDMHPPATASSRTNGNGSTSNGHSDHAGDVVVVRPLTDERVEVVRVMLRHQQRAGTPGVVASALNKPVRQIQTTMGRMVKAHQLDRIRNGVYQVPEAIAAQVAKMSPPQRIEGLQVIHQ